MGGHHEKGLVFFLPPIKSHVSFANIIILSFLLEFPKPSVKCVPHTQPLTQWLIEELRQGCEWWCRAHLERSPIQSSRLACVNVSREGRQTCEQMISELLLMGLDLWGGQRRCTPLDRWPSRGEERLCGIL